MRFFDFKAKDLIFSSNLANFLSLSDPSSADNETLFITFIPAEKSGKAMMIPFGHGTF
jgi:hypothetical protein